MADFKVPNLCGASPEFNAIQTKFESMITSALDGLEVDASTLKATLDTDVTALVSDLKAMIPELPALPEVNLQGQLTSLSGMAVGSGAHNTLLADITSKFGSALTAGGFSLDKLVSDAASAIAGGTNLCSAVPNFTVPAAGGEAVQKAVAVLQPAVDALPEKLSTLVENENFTELKTAVETTFASYDEIGEEVPTSDTGPYKVSEETTSIVIGDTSEESSGQGTTIKASTSKNMVTSITVTGGEETVLTSEKTEEIIDAGGMLTYAERANTVDPETSDGITTRPDKIRENFYEADVTKSGNTYKITLQNHPFARLRVYGASFASRTITRGRNKGQIKSRSKQRPIKPTGKGTLVLGGKTKEFDTYSLSGKEITITGGVEEYKPHLKQKGWVFKVRYDMLDNYDPNYSGAV